MLGGWNGSLCLRSCERYNPLEGRWNRIASMPTSRGHMGVCYCSLDKCVYAIGGWNGFHRLTTVEKYQPWNNKWIKLPDMQIPRCNLGATELNGYIYAVSLSMLPLLFLCISCNIPKDSHVFFSFSSSFPYHCSDIKQVGGSGVVRDADIVTKEAERYDPLTQKWEFICPLRDAREGIALAASSGALYMFGGWTSSSSRRLTSVDRYRSLAYALSYHLFFQ